MSTSLKNKKSQLLFLFFVLLTILSISATYYNTIVLKNFVIINDVTEEMLLEMEEEE